MTRVAITMLPEQGAFNATLSLARALAAGGNEVVYTGTSNFKEHVKRQGFEYVSFGPSAEESKRIQESFSRKSSLSTIIKTMKTVAGQMDAVYDDAYRWVESFQPDLVLLDPLISDTLAGPYLQHRVPILGLNTTLAYRYRSTSPAHFSRILPRDPNQSLVRLINISTWGLLRARNIARHLRNLPQAAFFGVALAASRQVNRSTAEQKKIRSFKKVVWGEYGYRLDVLELVLSPPEIDTPWNVSLDGRCYVGACVDTSRQDPSFDWSRFDPNKPLIYCSLGTYNGAYPHARRLFEALIEVMRSRPQHSLLLHGGEATDALLARDVPDNVVVARFVPQLQALERAQCIITHGGFSSVREACFWGVPMIVFPNWLDQFGNSARVVFHNIGVRGEIKSVTKSLLDSLLLRALGDSSISRSMSKMSAAFRRHQRYDNAIEYIEQFLSKQRRA